MRFQKIPLVSFHHLLCTKANRFRWSWGDKKPPMLTHQGSQVVFKHIVELAYLSGDQHKYHALKWQYHSLSFQRFFPWVP